MITTPIFNRKICLSKAYLILKSVALCTMVWLGMQTQVQAQEARYTIPSLWVGVAGGANFSDYSGNTQYLNNSFTSPVEFQDGKGVGLYLTPLMEYHHPDSRVGFMFQAGYDSRQGKFDSQNSPLCNCPADLSANFSYLTLEPSLRVEPFKSNLYLYAGPRVAIKIDKSFTYEESVDPDFPHIQPDPDVKGDFSHVIKVIVSMQIGAGYDIPLSTQNQATQFVLSPFVAFHPSFGQLPRTIESWDIGAIRAGVAFKFGFGDKIPVQMDAMESPVQFSVDAPEENSL